MGECVMSIVRDRRFGNANLKYVLGRLAWEAYDDVPHIVVSIETLADDCELGSETIQSVLLKADCLGVLGLEEGERGRWPRVYSIDVAYLAAAYPLTCIGGRRLAQRRGTA